MRVFVCRRDMHSAREAAELVMKAGHSIAACLISQHADVSAMRQSNADIFLLDRYMPHPEGETLKKALCPRSCVLIGTDLNAAMAELEKLSEQPLQGSTQRMLKEELLALGFRANTLGMRQMLSALCIVVRDERTLADLRHDVYARIAKENGVSWQSVERNLRYAIESVWTHGNLAALQRRFGETIDAERGKPTNKAFLAQIAEHIRFERA